MQPSTFKLEELCELCVYQASDARLSLILKDHILGYNNNDNFSTTLAAKDRRAWLDELKTVKNKQILGKQQEEYLQDLLHPELIYTKPKKPSYEVVREPFGKDNFMLKNYEDSFKGNLKNNIVETRLLEEDASKLGKQLKDNTNYVKDFFDTFGDILKSHSPEFWQLVLYDILKMVADPRKTDKQLNDELFAHLPDHQAIKYLTTFRKEITLYLEASEYFKESENSQVNLVDNLGIDKGEQKKKPKEKEKGTKFLLTEELAEVDFLKMKDNELALKIPTYRSRVEDQQCVYFRIDPMPKVDHKVPLISVSEAIPEEYVDCFESNKLNVIQSKVFHHAYNSTENMLVCAPTGAGKTNIATLTILNVIKRYGTDFKVIYISPMKALANELVHKFTKKFKNLKTREMTGDIQLSQKELASTHIIVTTPEKLDVVTRKNTGLIQQLKLVIFDEVHLLNDDRGWVLESLVARLFRSVFRTQKLIRIVGLSATLPNYYDVAAFLHVDSDGLFHFDTTFRPVPLMIHFFGIKGAADVQGSGRKRQPRDVYNEKCYEFCMRHIRNRKQVLVFVHSRKETVKYCEYIQERALQLGDDAYLGQSDKVVFKYKLTDKKLLKVAPASVAFHHAGMVRADRNEVERMFSSGDAKILVATATLAWGVNLPAYAVVIKGTDVYDVNLSESKDLSILDVQQMFGRAGRPQFDTNGEAALMTDFKKVNKYIGALTSIVPIESKFTEYLKEALNAEICSGTVTNELQAFEWLKYTFYAIRAFKNPTRYGCRLGSNQTEQQFFYEQFLRNKVVAVLNDLDKSKLIRYDRKNLTVSSTELGRITSHFYIKCETMDHFCSSLHITVGQNVSPQKKFDYKTDLKLLTILAQSKEFENIRVRMEEYEQLKKLIAYWILDEEPDFGMPGKGLGKNYGNYEQEIVIGTPQKVLLLLQGYLRDLRYENYSLTNDTQYIVQQGVRLLRCLFDLCCRKNQAMNVQIILKWCKYIENRMYKENNPLRQFLKISYTGYNSMRQKKDGFMPKDFYDRMDEVGLGVNDAIDLGPQDLSAKLGINHHRSAIAGEILRYCKYLPRVSVSYWVKPIAQTILKIDVDVLPRWNHDPKWHLKGEVFWVFFDDEEEILHSESFLIDEEFVVKKKPVQLSFFIPYRDNNQKKYRLLIRSDRWIMDEEDEETIVDLNELGIVMDALPFTPLLNIEPLPKTALKNPIFEQLYSRFNFFNPIQTQLFFPLYHTDNNILIGAPTGSGKTIMCELAVLRVFARTPEKKCVYIAPLKALAKERLEDWVPRFDKIKKSVVELTGDYTPDMETLMKAHVIITTPEKWDGITRKKDRKYAQNIGLIIFDEIHLLGQDRGAVIEVIVSRMNMNKQESVRMIGLSTAMANGGDVAEWFGAGQYNFFNFKPSVRPVPIEIHFEGFSEKSYCPRMATMNKPAYNCIKKFSDGKPVLIFVSSRRQTRLTALDLISLSEHETKGAIPFVKCSHEQIQAAIEQASDQYLKQTLLFGIGMHHAGLNSTDRKICQDLFVRNKIQILIATSTLAWGVNFPARLVIIKGTEYFDPKAHRYEQMPATDLLQMIGRAGRPQFDTKGVAVVYCEQSRKMFYRKYLNDPFPIESSLIPQIDDHINAEIARGTISNKQECIDWFTWSYAFRRILKNPNFYNLPDNKNESIKKFLCDLVDSSIQRLAQSNCVEVDDQRGTLAPKELGYIASNYYLKHETVRYFEKELKPNMTFKQVLWMISHAEQFKQTPLRHNEDNFNKQLSDVSPYKLSNKDYSSPQGKTFLLFQMHMFDLPPPIRDYVTDCKLIIDASTRVVLGAIEVATEKKLLDTTLTLIYLEQVIFQGLQCNIPYVDQQTWSDICRSDGFRGGLAQIVEELEDTKVRRDLVKFFKKGIEHFDRHKEQQIFDALKGVPKVKFHAELIAYDSQNSCVAEENVIYEQIEECVVRIELKKQNKAANKLTLQKGSKFKENSWWVVIGDCKNQLLSLKKVTLNQRARADILIPMPDSFKAHPELKLYLMNDSYRGIDQQLSIDLKRYIK